jgi:hypothetical protein
VTDFLVRRDDLRASKVVDGDEPAAAQAGEVVLHVERFGLTANNVTYGAFGDPMGYWQFFPAPDGWGRIPVWGFGDVIASAVDGIATGDRFFGYFPMSSHVTLRARPDDAGFTECSDGRAALPGSYNRYLRATPDRGFDPAHDDANVIMRVLYLTGWLIADQLERSDWSDAATVVLSSASSKTAFSTAFEIARRDPRPRIVGLTSPANRAFTEGLGCYDDVLTYDELASLPLDGGIAYVDMAGGGELRRAVHEQAGDALRSSLMVGATQWEHAQIASEGLPGPAPVFFFAPAHTEVLAASLGGVELQRQVGEAWGGFAGRVGDLLTIESSRGTDALARVYGDLLEGRADPSKGYVVSL